MKILSVLRKRPVSAVQARIRVALLVVIGAIAIALIAPSVSAFGGGDKWVSGWGQGIAEAIIMHGPGNQINVTCGDSYGESGHTSIRFMISGDSPKGNSIILTFDDEDPEPIWVSDGEITSNCRACMMNYLYVISRLKKHSSVHVLTEDGESVRFTLNGSQDAIGECEPDFNIY